MARVAVIGDAILDVMTVVRTTGKISGEAPSPIFTSVGRTHSRLGGAAAVAAMCSLLGADTCYIWCHRGGSTPITELLSTFHVKELHIPTKADVLTVKHRYIAEITSGFVPVFRLDTDKYVDKDYDFISIVLRHLEMSAPEIVIISDYGKGVCQPDLCMEVIEYCNDINIPVLVDPHVTSDYDAFAKCDFLVPNQAESKGMSARDLTLKYETRGCILKQGGNGCRAFSRDEALMHVAEGLHFKARPPKPLVDPIGAGDQFIAALAVIAIDLKSNLKIDWLKAVEYANVAASLQTEVLGVSPISREALSRAMLEVF